MTEETNAQPGAGAVAPAETTQQLPAPKSDAEAEQREATAAAQEPNDAE